MIKITSSEGQKYSMKFNVAYSSMENYYISSSHHRVTTWWIVVYSCTR